MTEKEMKEKQISESLEQGICDFRFVYSLNCQDQFLFDETDFLSHLMNSS